jgi:hypothetical protein
MMAHSFETDNKHCIGREHLALSLEDLTVELLPALALKLTALLTNSLLTANRKTSTECLHHSTGKRSRLTYHTPLVRLVGNNVCKSSTLFILSGSNLRIRSTNREVAQLQVKVRISRVGNKS